ncbi:hypothetical protein [Cyclobacterium xiamenense]|uniref:hypothetical protein n=1 Tax=Cyclobacterium xiamenense TaxID=1297121 RepID=UPI0035CF6594
MKNPWINLLQAIACFHCFRQTTWREAVHAASFRLAMRDAGTKALGTACFEEPEKVDIGSLRVTKRHISLYTYLFHH